MSGGEESGGFKRATAGIAEAKRFSTGRRKMGGEGRTHRQRARLKGEGEGREGEGDEDREVNEQLPNNPGAILFIAPSAFPAPACTASTPKYLPAPPRTTLVPRAAPV